MTHGSSVSWHQCLFLVCLFLSDFCCKDLDISVKPGFPKTIKTNDSEVLKAARHSVEKFNNSTNDIFLFKESRVSKALVQVRRTKSCHLRTDLANWATLPTASGQSCAAAETSVPQS